MDKRWSYQEIYFLKEHYGQKPLTWIAKKLGRTISALENKKNRCKLGKYTNYADDYISFNELSKICHLDGSWMHKLEKAKFPVKKIKRIREYMKIVYLSDFFRWIEKGNNKHLIDLANSEKGDFGAIEPKWFEDKRNADKRYREYKQTSWTEEENENLINLLKEYKYNYTDISKILMRLETAIKRQILTLKIPYRPLIADKHNNWSKQEIDIVKTLYRKGYKSIVIRDYLKNRSQLAINGLLERHNYFLEKGA